MKTTIVAFALGVVATGLVGFTVATTYEPRKSTAEVEQVQGYYIFVDSRPVLEYEYLGTIKKSMTWGSGQYQDVRDAILKKARKDYPTADGAILNFREGGADRVDMIRFKE